MPRNFDAVIIGAGALGAVVCLELTRLGYACLVADMRQGAGLGTTSDSCALVKPHCSTRTGVALAYEGMKFWQDWESRHTVPNGKDRARFINSGVLLIKSRALNWQRVKAHYNAVGVPYEEWDAPTLARHLPGICPAEFWPVKIPEHPRFSTPGPTHLAGAILCPGGGYVDDPGLWVRNTVDTARKRGAKFCFNAEVVAVRHQGCRVTGISLADGTRVDTPIVVNCSGPHSFKVNQMAKGVYQGCRIKTKALRHEIACCPAGGKPGIPGAGYAVSDGDVGCYVRPGNNNTLFIGSEDPECDPQEWVDPDAFGDGRGGPGRDNRVTAERFRAQTRRLCLRFPFLDIPDTPRGRVTLYDCSDDWIPVYDRSDMDGFYMAVGTSGRQFPEAPAAGRMMAGLIDRVENGLDHDAAPYQHPLDCLSGRTIDTGIFSRKRQIIQESSFSVNS